jgi:hypothetical protein
MTFRTIDTDMVSVGATLETDLTLDVARRARSSRRAAILGSRFGGMRASHYSKY